MAKCKKCGKSGLFLKINSVGLCQPCDHKRTIQAQENLSLINSTIWSIKEPGVVFDVIEGYNRLNLLLAPLLEYEKLGIPTISPSPSDYLAKISAQRDDDILAALKSDLDYHLEKLNELKTAKGKLNRLLTFYDTFDRVYEKLDNPAKALKIRKLLHKLELEYRNGA